MCENAHRGNCRRAKKTNNYDFKMGGTVRAVYRMIHDHLRCVNAKYFLLFPIVRFLT